jgi:hypothetical protein
MRNRKWILGASDPEMSMIETLLRECGEEVCYYTDAQGRRVHPGNAYLDHGVRYDNDSGETLMFVECLPVTYGNPLVEVVDHHRPGDRGYGVGPEAYFYGSSIGQVVRLMAKYCIQPREWQVEYELWRAYGEPGQLFTLRRDHVVSYGATHDDGDHAFLWLVVPTEILLVAAADHCLMAAYRGMCPGVDPDALMEWRMASRAAFQGRSVSDVMADVEAARKALRACIGLPSAQHPGEVIADFRKHQTLPEMPEAACREGIPFMATVTEIGGRVKEVLQAASPEMTRTVMEEWRQAGYEVYGDPARGFAGAYLN